MTTGKTKTQNAGEGDQDEKLTTSLPTIELPNDASHFSKATNHLYDMFGALLEAVFPNEESQDALEIFDQERRNSPLHQLALHPFQMYGDTDYEKVDKGVTASSRAKYK